MSENTKAGQYWPAPAQRTLERIKRRHQAPASLRRPAARPQEKVITGPTQNSGSESQPLRPLCKRPAAAARREPRTGAEPGAAADAPPATGLRRPGRGLGGGGGRAARSRLRRRRERARKLGRARGWRFLGAEAGERAEVRHEALRSGCSRAVSPTRGTRWEAGTARGGQVAGGLRAPAASRARGAGGRACGAGHAARWGRAARAGTEPWGRAPPPERPAGSPPRRSCRCRGGAEIPLLTKGRRDPLFSDRPSK